MTGAVTTLRLKAWLTSPLALAASKVRGVVPVAVGVPARVAVPLFSVPVHPSEGAGNPVVVTVKENALATITESEAALVMAGAELTSMIRVWVATGSIPLVAEMVTVVAPVAVGVPEIRSVPGVEPAPMDRPGGRVPVSTRVGVGPPLVVTATDPATPRLK